MQSPLATLHTCPEPQVLGATPLQHIQRTYYFSIIAFAQR
jgi:hypothetical protein